MSILLKMVFLYLKGMGTREVILLRVEDYWNYISWLCTPSKSGDILTLSYYFYRYQSDDIFKAILMFQFQIRKQRDNLYE